MLLMPLINLINTNIERCQKCFHLASNRDIQVLWMVDTALSASPWWWVGRGSGWQSVFNVISAIDVNILTSCHCIDGAALALWDHGEEWCWNMSGAALGHSVILVTGIHSYLFLLIHSSSSTVIYYSCIPHTILSVISTVPDWDYSYLQ